MEKKFSKNASHSIIIKITDKKDFDWLELNGRTLEISSARSIDGDGRYTVAFGYDHELKLRYPLYSNEEYYTEVESSSDGLLNRILNLFRRKNED